MAKSRFEYVKEFEVQDRLLPNTWVVVRIDGRGFHKFSKQHEYRKPNDARALRLMNHCAQAVLQEFGDIVFAYGESDEYSFVFRKDTGLFKRRRSKLESNVVSFFAASFVFHWPTFFPDSTLQYAPTFDARAVCYPSVQNLRDYISWRQADTHINNLYNTCFWSLVQAGTSEQEAERELAGTDSEFKNELLHSKFDTNYAELPAMFRRGSCVFRDYIGKEGEGRERRVVVVAHCDVIGDEFWTSRPWLLGAGTQSKRQLKRQRLQERKRQRAEADS